MKIVNSCFSKDKNRQVVSEILCDCGKTFYKQNRSIRKGREYDCGCQKGTRTSWKSMVSRATIKPGYVSHRPSYYSRGIDDSWLTYENFYKDLGIRPEGASIERIDNKIGYFPGNCRWELSQKVQNQNKSNTRRVVLSGVEMSIHQAIKVTNSKVSSTRANRRISEKYDQQWSLEESLGLTERKHRAKNNILYKKDGVDKPLREWLIEAGLTSLKDYQIAYGRIKNGSSLEQAIEEGQTKQLRLVKVIGRIFTYQDKTKSIKDWCVELNLCSKLVSGRIGKGWSIERSLEIDKTNPIAKDLKIYDDLFTYQGTTQTIRQWAAQQNKRTGHVGQQLKRGRTLEAALNLQ